MIHSYPYRNRRSHILEFQSKREKEEITKQQEEKAEREAVETWNKLSALAWLGFVTFGRGVVILNPPTKQASFAALGNDGFAELVDDPEDIEAIKDLVAEYNPNRALVLFMSSPEDWDARIVMPTTENMMLPPQAYQAQQHLSSE